VVASLHYGLRGGVATVGWVTVLCIPRMVEAAERPSVAALWVEFLQLAVLGAIAVLVGRQVSAQERVHDQADSARRARLRTELLYRDLFESNRSPILIVDADGHVVESNPSADHSFGTSEVPVTGAGSPARGSRDTGRRLVDVIGPDAAALVLTRLVSDDVLAGDGPGGPAARPDGRDGTSDDTLPRSETSSVDRRGPRSDTDGPDDRVLPVAFDVDGHRVLYRPTATLVGSSGTDRRMQVIFEDVTAETRRHDLMEAYAGRVVLGQEEERRHIAQELHDGPLQTLIHLCRQIDSLVDRPSPRDDGRMAASPPPESLHIPTDAATVSLSAMRTTVEETVAELRSIARGLRPSVLDDLGLVASLNQVLADAADRQGFETACTVSGAVRRLPAAVELAVFRIAQEAVNNVERHAAASRVEVTLSFGETGLRLRVQDDGIGFDRASQGNDGRSLGLPGMHERARLIGGLLQVHSAEGTGTVVELGVPWAMLRNP